MSSSVWLLLLFVLLLLLVITVFLPHDLLIQVAAPPAGVVASDALVELAPIGEAVVVARHERVVAGEHARIQRASWPGCRQHR